MKPPKVNNFRFQLIVFLTVCLVLSLSLLTGYSLVSESRKASYHIRQQAKLIADNLATSSVNFFLLKDLASLEEYFLMFINYPNIREITALDARGRVLSRMRHQDQGPVQLLFEARTMTVPKTAETRVLVRKGYLEVWAPVKSLTTLGWIQLRYSLKGLPAVQRAILYTGIFMGLGVIGINVFLILLFLRKPLWAIQEITRFSRNLVLNKGEQIHLGSDTEEIVSLERALNEASRQLYERDQRLKESEEKFRNITSAANDAIVMMDDNDNISYWNPAAERIFGFKSEEVMGLPLHQVVAPARYRPLADQGVKEFKKTGKGPIVGVMREIEARHKDGYEFAVELSVSAIEFKGRWHAIGIIRDITERKKMENALREEREKALQLSRQAQESARVKSEFLANMSHEIRTPMNAILGFGDLLGRTSLNEQQAEYLRVIQTHGKLLINIINDILDFSKFETSQVTFEEIPFDLPYLVSDLITLVIHKVDSSKVRVSSRIDPLVPRHLVGDPSRLRQVLLNLLNNAMKFTEKGNICLSVELVKEVEERDDARVILRFVIQDTGIGIPQERQNMIFQAFTQADNSTTRKYGGTGLGLAICKSLVEGMGGEISVCSEPGRGSEFAFTIRCRRTTATEESASVLTRADLEKKRVMIVDGNQVNRKILRFCCEDASLNLVAVSESVPAALRKMDDLIKDQQCPDIVLCAVHLADTALSRDFLKKIHNNAASRHVKVVAVCAEGEVGQAKATEVLGFDGFLAHPVEPEALLKVLISLYNKFSGEGEKGGIVTRHSAEETICQGVRVLVVEDQPANRDLLKAFFDILGCQADYAENGKEAVEKIRQNSYDLCLMDVQMPVMGGLEATRVIRTELKSRVPILTLSAGVLPGDIEQCLEAGMDDFIRKPVTLEKIKEKILQYTRLKKA